MNIFTKPDQSLTPIIAKYKKSKEVPQISIPIEYNGKQYREIVFFKSSLFGTPTDKMNGIVLIDQSGAVVTDKRIQKELSTLFYNLELLFIDKYTASLSKAIVSEKQLAIDAEDAEYLEANLMLLKTDKTEGLEIVSGIVKKLTDLKRENNTAIEKFIEEVKKYKNAESISGTVINEVKPLYNNTLIKNFEKVKLIGSGRNYYGEIKKEINKLFKRKIMRSGATGSASTMEYTFNYLMRVVNLYDSVIDMSHAEYIKYLNEAEKNQIHERVEKLRF